MMAVIIIADLNQGGGDTIGFSVNCISDRTDTGVTKAGFLVHQLAETLGHIAIRTDTLNAPARPQQPEDRLIDIDEVAWLVWSHEPPKRADFPAPVAENPRLWKRSDVMQWMRIHQPRRIDLDRAQAFIRKTYPQWEAQ